MRWCSRLFRCLTVTTCLFVAACASPPPPPPPPKPTIAQVSIEALPTVNPDARGRPSPVLVKFYELKSLAVFNSVDFFSLFEKDKDTLGAELVAREEFQLMPGARRSFEREVQADTRYLGVVAAFRDLERAQWRATIEVKPHQTTPLSIRLDKSTVTMVTP
jgi:type VI secretion system protein VasD